MAKKADFRCPALDANSNPGLFTMYPSYSMSLDTQFASVVTKCQETPNCNYVSYMSSGGLGVGCKDADPLVADSTQHIYHVYRPRSNEPVSWRTMRFTDRPTCKPQICVAEMLLGAPEEGRVDQMSFFQGSAKFLLEAQETGVVTIRVNLHTPEKETGRFLGPGICDQKLRQENIELDTSASNINACPSGSGQIDNTDDCKVAAAKLGLTWGTLTPSSYTSTVCTESLPCSACVGDCNSDSDCAGDLKCMQREGGELVAGCSLASDDFSGNSDFCGVGKDYPEAA